MPGNVWEWEVALALQTCLATQIHYRKGKKEESAPRCTYNFVRVDRSSNIVFLNHDPVKIDKGFGDHIEPFVRKSFCLLLKSISQESSPS